MSTDSTYIPADDEIALQSGGSMPWRPSHGKFVRGEEIEKMVDVEGDGVLAPFKTGRYPEERLRIVGLLRRVGIHQSAQGKYGPQHRLECDIEASDGLVHVGTNLIGLKGELKVGISTVNLAWCLMQFGKDETIMLETASGEPMTLENGSKGPRPTYVNCARVEARTDAAGEMVLKDGKPQFSAKPIYRPKRDPAASKQTLEERWGDLETQLRAHPAYAERPASTADASGSHLAALIAECQAKGFPSVTENDLGYARFLSALYNDGLTPTGLAFYSDNRIGQFQLDLSEVTVLTPDALKIIEDAKAPAAAPVVNAGLLG